MSNVCGEYKIRSSQMAKRIFFSLMIMSVTLLVAACGPAATPATTGNVTSSIDQTVISQLTSGYENALSLQEQLALGTWQLEGTDLAINKMQAAELLPLWRALQSLNNSDTTATVELNAVIYQIEESMTPEQIQAIAAMALTNDNLAASLANGDLSTGQLAGTGSQNSAEPASGPPAGLDPGIAPAPGNGIPGEGPGLAAGDQSQEDLVTRQAARESGAFAGFQGQALTSLVISLLENKTGLASTGANGVN